MTDLRTRLKKSAAAAGSKTQQSLQQELGALEKLIDTHDLGQPRRENKLYPTLGLGNGDATVTTGKLSGVEGMSSLEHKLGTGVGRSEERDVLATLVAKAAAPSHTATKADKRLMNKPRLDDSGS